MNLAALLTDSATRHPDHTAIKLDELEISYRQLDEWSAHAAELMREKGVGRGDRLGIMLPNVPQFAVTYYGVLRAGGTVVPMNPLLKGREVRFYLTDPEAKVVFAWHEFAGAARDGAEDTSAEAVIVAPGSFEELPSGPEPISRWSSATPATPW